MFFNPLTKIGMSEPHPRLDKIDNEYLPSLEPPDTKSVKCHKAVNCQKCVRMIPNWVKK